MRVSEKCLYGMFPTGQGSQHKQEVLPVGMWVCPYSPTVSVKHVSHYNCLFSSSPNADNEPRYKFVQIR